MKIDPYKHKERYLKWKEGNKDRILDLDQKNSDIILQYLNDMEKGINISSGSIKGSRSYIRLNTLRSKMLFIIKKTKEIYGLNKIIDISEEQLVGFFSDMKNGNIKRLEILFKEIFLDNSNMIAPLFYLFGLRVWADHLNNKDKFDNVVKLLGLKQNSAFNEIYNTFIKQLHNTLNWMLNKIILN